MTDERDGATRFTPADASPRRCDRKDAPRTRLGPPHPLYDVADVEAALGHLSGSGAAAGFGEDPDAPPPTADSEHERRLAHIVALGEGARWRSLARPERAALTALDALDRAAPHFAQMTGMVRRHLAAAAAIGLPIGFPCTMLVGQPGVGKTWYLTRLAQALGVPFRHYPMNGSTLGEGLFGSAPNWRNASPGLVAKTLLREVVANPILLVDEIDKPVSRGREDPYRPFYTLLEPEGARAFVDEYLTFPMDASAVMWVLAGNSTEPLPEPILGRLVVLEVPPLDRDGLAAVAASIYRDANAANLGFFDDEPTGAVLDAFLASCACPRLIRFALRDAMVTAAADGRRTVQVRDVRIRPRGATRRYGF